MKFGAKVSLLSLLLIATPVLAESTDQRLERLEKELQTLKTEKSAQAAQGGGSPRLSIGGYGEINYNNYDDSDKQDQFDMRRFVLYVGYRFSDSIKLISELEFEHGFFENGEGNGELAMEQAYLNFRLSDAANIRAGLMLMPVGLLNEYHEPTVFYGVERNDVETRILPSTWRELGLALQGVVAEGLEYNVGIVTSPDSSRHEDFASGFREYRTKASKSPANDLGLYAALNWRGMPGLLVGGSLFTGNTSQDGRGENPSAILGAVNARLTVWDLHAKYSVAGLDLRALYAAGKLADTEAINAAAGLTAGSDEAAGKSFYGWLIEGAYHVWKQGDHDLAPFVRYERYNTQKSVAAGFTADPKNDETVLTVGIDYKPHPQVVIKADFQNYKQDDKKDRINLGIGFMF